MIVDQLLKILLAFYSLKLNSTCRSLLRSQEMCLKSGAKQTPIACGMKERCFVNLCPRSTRLLPQGLLLIDVLDNQIMRRRGNKEDQDRCLIWWRFFRWPTIVMINRCLQVAVEEGFYMTSNQERGGITDILLLFRKLHTFFRLCWCFLDLLSINIALLQI